MLFMAVGQVVNQTSKRRVKLRAETGLCRAKDFLMRKNRKRRLKPKRKI
jgi:hypothetical protein